MTAKDLFSHAKIVPLPTNGHGNGNGGSNGQKQEINLGEDLTTLATLKALTKSVELLSKTYDERVKARMTEEFTKVAVATGKRPPNFRGVSSKAEASCELRKRASTQALNEHEIGLLAAADIPIAEDVIEEAVPERYFFNPELVADKDLAARISDALAHIPELQGKDIVLRQPAREAVVKKCVSDEALDAVAATRDPQLIKELLPIVSCLAIRVKLVSELSEAIGLLKGAEVNL